MRAGVPLKHHIALKHCTSRGGSLLWHCCACLQVQLHTTDQSCSMCCTGEQRGSLQCTSEQSCSMCCTSKQSCTEHSRATCCVHCHLTVSCSWMRACLQVCVTGSHRPRWCQHGRLPLICTARHTSILRQHARFPMWLCSMHAHFETPRSLHTSHAPRSCAMPPKRRRKALAGCQPRHPPHACTTCITPQLPGVPCSPKGTEQSRYTYPLPVASTTGNLVLLHAGWAGKYVGSAAISYNSQLVFAGATGAVTPMGLFYDSAGTALSGAPLYLRSLCAVSVCVVSVQCLSVSSLTSFCLCCLCTVSVCVVSVQCPSVPSLYSPYLLR